MNKAWVLFNLKEALEELKRTIKEIESDPEYDFGQYLVAMEHLYHHINTAWNSRNSTNQEDEECSESNFAKDRQFPSDLDMSC